MKQLKDFGPRHRAQLFHHKCDLTSIKKYLLVFVLFLWLTNYNLVSFTYDMPRTAFLDNANDSSHKINQLLIALKDKLYKVDASNREGANYRALLESQSEFKLALPNLSLKNYSIFCGLTSDYWSYKVERCDVILNLGAKKRITDVIYNSTSSYVTSNYPMKYTTSTLFNVALKDTEKEEIYVHLPSVIKNSAKIDNYIELYLSPKSYGWVEFTPFYYKVVGTISWYNWHGELKSEKQVTTLIPKNTNGLLEGIYYIMESKNSP